jgi:hypothetical protein
MNASVSARDDAVTIIDCSRNFPATSGIWSVSMTALESLAVMSGGVCGGAIMAYQVAE